MRLGLDQQWGAGAVHVPPAQVLEKGLELTLQVDGQGSHAWEKRVEGCRLSSATSLLTVRRITVPRKENWGQHPCPDCCCLLFKLSEWSMFLETVPLFQSLLSYAREIYGPFPGSGYLYCIFKYLELLRPDAIFSLWGIFSPTNKKAMKCLRWALSSLSWRT